MYDRFRGTGGGSVIPSRDDESAARDGVAGTGGADLAATVIFAVGAAGVLLYSGSPRPLVWAVGVPFLLVCPGYAVVSAAFPERPDADRSAMAGRTETTTDLGWAGRLALSVATSAVAVALVVVALNRLAAIGLAPVVAGVLVVTLVGVAVAVRRRRGLDPAFRAAPVAALADRFERGGTDRPTVALLLAAVLLVGAVAVVGGAPPQGQQFSESSLLTENATGDLVADGYPTTFVAGEGHPLALAIENNEHRPVTYEVVVLAQDVAADGSVTGQRRIDAFAVTTVHGERRVVERTIAPTTTGDSVRLRFRIYKRGVDGAPDGDGGVDSTDSGVNSDVPDQTLQLWIEVVDG